MFHSLSIEAAARTETGRRRDINQDAVAVRPDLSLYLLADGMGGHAAGEVAAAIAVESMEEFYLDAGATWPLDAEGPATDPRAFLVAAAKHANYRVRQLGALHPEYGGMGAAVAGVHVGSSGFCLVHVGHVRVYRVRDGVLEPLTEDDTQLNRYVAQGEAYEQAREKPDADRLVRALGQRASVQVTSRLEDARPGDVVVLVSNGLYKSMPEQQMKRILAGRTALGAMADNLITVAQAHHAPDDVSCVLLRWHAAEVPSTET